MVFYPKRRFFSIKRLRRSVFALIKLKLILGA